MGSIPETDRILVYGHRVPGNRKLEFKNCFEFTPDVRIRDTWYRQEGGEGKQGPSLEPAPVRE